MLFSAALRTETVFDVVCLNSENGAFNQQRTAAGAICVLEFRQAHVSDINVFEPGFFCKMCGSLQSVARSGRQVKQLILRAEA